MYNLLTILTTIEGKTLVVLKSLEDEKNESLSTINKDINRFKEFNLNTIFYKKILTGYDLSFFDNVIFYGFEKTFFDTDEGCQLKGRFIRFNSKCPNFKLV
jgi:hypothetical protein